MPDDPIEDFLRSAKGAGPAVADPVEDFVASAQAAPPAAAKPALPGASSHLASSADFSGKPPVMSGAFRPSLGAPDRGGVTLGDAAKTTAAAVGGGILDVADRMTGKVQEATEAGINALLPSGSRVPDTSREGLSWEERLRTAGGPRETPRPVSGAADRINQWLGTGAPSVEATRAGLSRDPAVAQGLAAGRDASAPVGDTLLMIGGGGLLGKGIGATKVGQALNTVGVGRVATHAAGFAGANLALDPEHPREAIVNGITASLGAQGAAKIAAPWLGKILERAGRGSGAASPRFIGALRGAAEGVGMSASPHMDANGNWHSALLQGDAKTVAINTLLATLLGAGAKEVPPDVQRAYILGRVGEVPPEYLPVLNQIAGPVYDAARKVAAEGGAKSTNEAVTSLVKEDMGAFARAAGQRAEVEAGPRETAVLEAQDAAAAPPPPPTLPAPVESAPVAPAPATAPAEAAPALAPIGKTADGRTVFGTGDKFYVRGTGGRLGAAHPGEVAEARAQTSAPRVPPEIARLTKEEIARQRDERGSDDITDRYLFHESDAPGLAQTGINPSDVGGVVWTSRDTIANGGRQHAYAIDTTRLPPGAVVTTDNRFPGIKGGVPPEAVVDLGPVDPAHGLSRGDLLGRFQRAGQAAPEAPAAPVAMPPRAFGRKSADTLQAEGEGKSLSQHVREMGGINADEAAGLTGEMRLLSQKEAGTSGILRRGGGRSAEEMMASARESGFDIPADMAPADFLQRVLEDVQGSKTLNPATVDTAKLGEASLRRQAEEGNARLAELPPAERARVEAENQARLKETEADLAMERAEREAIQAVENGDADTSFDFGANALGASAKEGDVIQRPRSVLDAAERAGFPGAREARENLDALPESTTRWDPVEKRWTRDPVEPAIEGTFQPGANVTGTTREGEPVTGSVVRTTDRSTIIDTPEGQRSIPKGKVQRDPPGIYLGSGLGGAQQFVEAVGPAIEKGAKALARHGQGLIDWVTMKTNPRMSRSSPVAGRYAGGIIGSHATSNLVAPVWLERVFGENPSADVLAKFGHAAAEWQFTARRKALEAEIANAPDPVSKAKAEDALDKVGTFVGADGSPFQTQADLDAYMASPEWKAQSEAWRKQWNEAEIVPGGMLPGPERMYRDLTGKTEDPDLFTSDDRDILRVNMKPIEADAEGGTQPVYRSASGRLTAPRLRGHAFARPFSGTATKYETDPRALIQNTYQRVHAEWLKPQLYDQLIRTGDAARTNLKDPSWRPPTKIKGEDVVPFRITDSRTIIAGGKSITVPGETLYVRKGLEGELRQTLRTDPAAQQALAAKMLNTAALTGIADNVWNLMLDSMIPGSAPGHITDPKLKGVSLLPMIGGETTGLANNVVGMLKQLAYTVRRPKNYAETALRLSADAAWRGSRGEEWTPAYVRKSLSEFFGGDPTTMAFRAPVAVAKVAMGGLGRIAQRVHEAGRIVLDQAFDNLVKAGLVKDDPVGRREFINRLGQYAGRGMGRFTEAARDLGVQPFIVAKKKSAAEIGRKAAFSPGVKATDPLAAAQLRVGQAMRLFTFLATAGVINYVKSGSIEGRIGTPLGNTDTGKDNDKGNPTSSGILGDLTGYGPMLRGIGATGLFKAKQQNLTAGDQFGEWAKGPTNAFITKWLSSPVMDFGARILSGKTMPQALGYGGGPRAEPAIGPAPQMLNNLVFAGRQAAQLGPVATQAADKVLGTNLTPEYAPDAADEFMDLLRTFAPKRGMTAETMGDMRAIRSHGKAADWKSWAVEKQRDMGSGKEWWEFVRKRIEESELEKRDKDRLLQDLAPKRGR